MTRILKFRAWDRVKNRMYSASEMGEDQEALLPDGRGFANISGVDTRFTQIHRHLIPLQFTGLFDKNGKEIYEGDVVKSDTFKHVSGKIFWHSDGAWWIGDGQIGMEICCLTNNKDCRNTAEVIGNIYENPELLNDDKNK